jgi:hypothetical protein
MLTFKPTDKAFAKDLAAKGYGLFVDELTQETVLVTHAEDSGALSSALRGPIPKPDLIVCCHPAKAARQYPHLRFAGDWEGKTKPVLNQDGFFVFSEDEL